MNILGLVGGIYKAISLGNLKELLDFGFLYRLTTGFTIEELRTISIEQAQIASNIQCNEDGKRGPFRVRWDILPEDVIDNDGTIIINENGFVLERIWDNVLDIRWFGAKIDTQIGREELISINVTNVVPTSGQILINIRGLEVTVDIDFSDNTSTLIAEKIFDKLDRSIEVKKLWNVVVFGNQVKLIANEKKTKTGNVSIVCPVGIDANITVSAAGVSNVVVSDDYYAIQKCLDYAKTVNKEVTILFPYNQGKGCSVSDDLQITFSNVTIELKCNVFSTKGQAGTYPRVFDFDSKTDEALSNLKFKGNFFTVDGNKNNAVGFVYPEPYGGGLAYSCIRFYNCQNIEIDKVKCKNGLILCCAIFCCKDIVVKDSEFWNSGKDNGCDIYATLGQFAYNEDDKTTWTNAIFDNCKFYYNWDFGSANFQGVGVTYRNCISSRNGNTENLGNPAGGSGGGGFSSEAHNMRYLRQHTTWDNCFVDGNIGQGILIDGSSCYIKGTTISNQKDWGTGNNEGFRRAFGGNGIHLNSPKFDIRIENVTVEKCECYGLNYINTDPISTEFPDPFLDSLKIDNLTISETNYQAISCFGVGADFDFKNVKIKSANLKSTEKEAVTFYNGGAFNQNGGALSIDELYVEDNPGPAVYSTGIKTLKIGTIRAKNTNKSSNYAVFRLENTATTNNDLSIAFIEAKQINTASSVLFVTGYENFFCGLIDTDISALFGSKRPNRKIFTGAVSMDYTSFRKQSALPPVEDNEFKLLCNGSKRPSFLMSTGYEFEFVFPTTSGYSYTFPSQTGLLLVDGLAKDVRLNNVDIGLGLSNNINNIRLGLNALKSLTSGVANTALGQYVLSNLVTGSGNAGAGFTALLSLINGSNNTAFGNEALRNATGSGNVALGNQAGKNETGSNKLHIANKDTESLIEGDFSARSAKINGSFSVEKIALKSTGDSPTCGFATLVGGFVDIPTKAVNSTSVHIAYSALPQGQYNGKLRVTNITDNVSFRISSSDPSDTVKISWSLTILN